MKSVLQTAGRSRFVAAGAIAVVLVCVYLYGSRLAQPHTPKRVAPLSTVNRLLQPGHHVQVMDPYKMPIEPSAVCRPLQSAKNHEKICVYKSEEDEYISKVINNNGLWEGEYVSHLIALMARDPDLGFVDVGVNLGVFTLTMASYGRKVVGVEPFPPNLRRLAQSLRSSPHIIPYVTVIPMATSDKNEVMHFWARAQHPGATQLHAASKSAELAKGASTHHQVSGTSVNSTTLDQILPLLTFNKAILKIDIEGGEYLTFKGANHFFNSIHIPYIFMEWDNKCKLPKWRKFFIDFFRERRYTVHKSTRRMEPLELSEKGCATWPFDIILKKQE